MTAKHPHPLGSLPASSSKLLTQIAQCGWIAQGTVVCRSLRRKAGGRWVEKGPYYLWTAKEGGKTICKALSKDQYRVAKNAIEANRRTMQNLARLQSLTMQTILKKIPGVQKRK